VVFGFYGIYLQLVLRPSARLAKPHFKKRTARSAPVVLVGDEVTSLKLKTRAEYLSLLTSSPTGLAWGARCPGGRSRRRAKNRNPNGIESFSPRLRGRATLGNRPTNSSTRNGLYHPPPTRMKPRWGKIHFTIITRRSRCASTPG
jgi:hypothetical protein